VGNDLAQHTFNGDVVAVKSAKTFSIIARAIGIDVDVFREIAPALVWLDESDDS
jgi:hypothetical protein